MSDRGTVEAAIASLSREALDRLLSDAAKLGGGEMGADLMQGAMSRLRAESQDVTFDPAADDLRRRITALMAAAAISELRRRLGFLPEALAKTSTIALGNNLDEEVIDRIGSAVLVLARADALWKDPESARLFLTTPHPMLGTKMPIELIDTKAGAAAVLSLISRMAHGDPL